MSAPVDFEGRVAVVTGGASGIGAATVRLLRARGARVAVLDPADPVGPTDTTDGAELHLPVDCRRADLVDEAVTAIEQRWGRIDVLVNAAGVELVAAIDATTDEAWHRVLDTNLSASFVTCRRILPALRATRGAVVNVSSQLALVGTSSFSAYVASKAGLLGFTRSLAVEEAAGGVRVNAVAPGAVDTPLLRRQFASGRGPQGTLQDLVDAHPVGRLGVPDDIAGPIVFLCSEQAAFITGSTLVVDGGYTAV